jgi:hypothetical protein
MAWIRWMSEPERATLYYAVKLTRVPTPVGGDDVTLLRAAGLADSRLPTPVRP